MPRPLGHIRILVSARVLFDLEEADAIFKKDGEQAYNDYLRGEGKYAKDYVPELGGRKLKQGPLWSFVQAALAANKPGEAPVIEVGLLCKDTAESAVPIFRNLDLQGLHDVQYRLATSGAPLDLTMLHTFDTDLLLTRNDADVQLAVDNDIAAARVNMAPAGAQYAHQEGPLRIFVDGDAVAVGSSSELVYQRDGLDQYQQHEKDSFDIEMEKGPFTDFLAKASALNAQLPKDQQPIKIALLTARGSLASSHMITASKKLGIDFNGGMFFMSGSSKSDVLRIQRPDIFFDDQMVHLEESSKYCATGHVAYAENSPIKLFHKQKEEMLKKQKAKAAKKPAAKKKPTPKP